MFGIFDSITDAIGDIKDAIVDKIEDKIESAGDRLVDKINGEREEHPGLTDVEAKFAKKLKRIGLNDAQIEEKLTELRQRCAETHLRVHQISHAARDVKRPELKESGLSLRDKFELRREEIRHGLKDDPAGENSSKPPTPNDECNEDKSKEREVTREVEKKESSAPQNIESIDAELDALIGLKSVKDDLKEIRAHLKVQAARSEHGLKKSGLSYHCVFTGNPGTGKTTVARILARIYRELGIVKSDHIVEVDRSKLVAEYIGHTAKLTNKMIDEALDGVLFIDEAYSLAEGGEKDFGREAINTLLKRMEDDRDRLVVIVAGYPDEMQKFIEMNPGLKSRFTRTIHFPDYNAEELMEIFLRMARKEDYRFDNEAVSALRLLTARMIETKDKNFANARTVRNCFQETIKKQGTRLAPDAAKLGIADLMTIKAEDLPSEI